jgi:hypothetical protein
MAGARVTVDEFEEDRGGFGARMRSIHPRADLATTTDGDGWFRVHGEAPHRLSVAAAEPGSVLREAVECDAGTLDVLLVLERAGALVATLAPESLELAVLVGVEVRRVGEARDVDGAVSRFRDGALRRDGLRAGHYDVVVLPRIGPKPLWSVRGVAILPGGVAEDPRLRDIDLRALVRSIVVEVVDPGGLPVERALVMAFDRRSGAGQHTDAGGRGELVVGADGVDLEVSAGGFRRTRIAGVRADARIELRPALEVELVCRGARGDLQLDGGGRARISVSIVPVAEPPAWGSGIAGHELPRPLPDGDDPVVRFEVDDPGRYRVQWSVGRIVDGEVRSHAYLHDLPAAFVDVDDVVGAQARSIDSDPGLGSAALARLSRGDPWSGR